MELLELRGNPRMWRMWKCKNLKGGSLSYISIKFHDSVVKTVKFSLLQPKILAYLPKFRGFPQGVGGGAEKILHASTLMNICVKFHGASSFSLGVLFVNRRTDGRTDGRTDQVIPIVSSPLGGVATKNFGNAISGDAAREFIITILWRNNQQSLDRARRILESRFVSLSEFLNYRTFH